MFGLTALELARIQFGFTVSFHIIFPAITIGLASYLVVLEGLVAVEEAGRSIAGCIISGRRSSPSTLPWASSPALVMAYQFGTNWSYFSAFAGSVTGPLLTYEVLTAFFLEAGFLGVTLFGWNKVGPGLHFFATLMVAAGTLISATWILASNSWMQTPQGYRNHRRPHRSRRLAEDHLQSVLPVPPRAYDDRGLSRDRAVRRRFRRLASAEAPRYAGRAHDAVDGDVDDAHRRAGPDRRRRRAWSQHAALPAGEDRRDRRPLGEQAWRERAADPVRLAGHARRRDPGRGRYPAPRQLDPDPFLEWQFPRSGRLPA